MKNIFVTKKYFEYLIKNIYHLKNNKFCKNIENISNDDKSIMPLKKEYLTEILNYDSIIIYEISKLIMIR